MKPVRKPNIVLTVETDEQKKRQCRHGVDYGVAIKQRVFSGFGKNALSKGYEDEEPTTDDDVKDDVKDDLTDEEPD